MFTCFFSTIYTHYTRKQGVTKSLAKNDEQKMTDYDNIHIAEKLQRQATERSRDN